VRTWPKSPSGVHIEINVHSLAFAFILLSPSESALAAAAERRGLRVTWGGRFHHLTGPADKGRAVRQLLALHSGPVSSVALGDSANDLTMLEAVDRPVLVPRPDGNVSEVLARALPSAERAPWPGPRGWNEAVLAMLRDR